MFISTRPVWKPQGNHMQGCITWDVNPKFSREYEKNIGPNPACPWHSLDLPMSITHLATPSKIHYRRDIKVYLKDVNNLI